jgi:hypothetical protein
MSAAIQRMTVRNLPSRSACAYVDGNTLPHTSRTVSNKRSKKKQQQNQKTTKTTFTNQNVGNPGTNARVCVM